MSERRIVLGIDTSNYTTSASLLYEDGELIANIKYPLTVKEGERGLRQSDAVFSHTKNIPLIMRDIRTALGTREISAVGVSTRPRNVDGSYMPCFLSGVAAAESIAQILNVPLYEFSHQCGHVMAALYSSGRFDLLDGRKFVAFHVSGGTTEMLSVKADENGFLTELLGGTADLNAGQIIDRIGVHIGLKFPAGPEIERLALNNKEKIPKKKISIKNLTVNLSGLENMALKLYSDTQNKELTSAFVLEYIADSLIGLCSAYEEAFGKVDFVFAGGVMSNSIIKSKISEKFTASFAEPMLSADNAVGIAYLTARKI